LYIDEIAHKKGQGQFMTIISDDEDVKEKILTIPNISKIQKVCIDMCAPFAKAIREAIPYAVIISDRFHIIKKINECLLNWNKKTYKNLDEKEREPFSNIRFLLVKYRKKLTKWEKLQIKKYLQLNKEMRCIYWKVQGFREILFNYHGYKHSFVSQKLGQWIQGTRKYFKEFIKTLENWWDEVVNACIYKESNARQEGINNKIFFTKIYKNFLLS
jgi:transposase